jgi:hypothetical protein
MSKTDGFLLREQAGQWHPHALTKGPFPGLHGGIAAGALTCAMNQAARDIDAGEGVSLSCQLLRPPKIEPFEIEVETVRPGRQTSFFAGTMTQNGKEMARAQAVFNKSKDLDFVPDAALEPLEPEGEEYNVGPYSEDTPWLRDACNMWRADNGRFWLRLNHPLMADAPGLAWIAVMCDFTSGLSRPGWFDGSPLVAFPNADLAVHLTRQPVGEWLAVDGTPHWTKQGWGATVTALYDEAGYLGRSAQSIVLVK